MLPTKSEMITWIEEESKKEHIGPSPWKKASIFVFPLVSLALQTSRPTQPSNGTTQPHRIMLPREY